MKYAILVALLPLQGCLFFFAVPTSIFDANNACVARSATVGMKIKGPDGRTGTLMSTAGASSRCQNADLPLLAEIKYDQPAPMKER